MDGAFLATSDGQRVSVRSDGIIGRASEAMITFDIAKMSRRHARIFCRTGSWWLQDLASKNGTFVNGEALGTDATCLADGDELVFGGAVSAVFNDPAATPIAPRIGRLDGVWIDPSSHAVWVDAVRIDPPLSAKQLALLQLLDEHRGDVVSRPTITAEVWADDAAAGVSDDAISALIKRLRARLNESPVQGDYIEIVKGRGIRLTD